MADSPHATFLLLFEEHWRELGGQKTIFTLFDPLYFTSMRVGGGLNNRGGGGDGEKGDRSLSLLFKFCLRGHRVLWIYRVCICLQRNMCASLNLKRAFICLTTIMTSFWVGNRVFTACSICFMGSWWKKKKNKLKHQGDVRENLEFIFNNSNIYLYACLFFNKSNN